MLKVSPSRRFWKRVDIKGTDECWYWKGAKTTHGYGYFWLETKMVHAHRYALLGDKLELEPLCVLHSCDHKACCNPNHLSLGTNAQNRGEASDRGLAKQLTQRKFYDEDVWLIRKLGTKLTQAFIAKMYKTSHSVIGCIIKDLNYPTKGGFINPNFKIVK